jgi:hypothetical protein
MMKRWLVALLFVLLVPTIAVTDETRGQATSPAEQYKALVDEYEDVGGAKQFVTRFFELAEKHAKDPVAIDALVWVIEKRRNQPEAIRAIELLQKRHFESMALDRACRSISRVPSRAAENLLGSILKSNESADVRAQACYFLAELLERKVEVVDQLKGEPELVERVLEYYGEDYGKHLLSLTTAKLAQQLEQVYQRMAGSFPDVEIGDEKMGEIALRALFRIRHLSVGRVAPEIESEDISGKQFKLSEYRGKVVMLSFWGHW